jgi:hypothetical protein
LAKINEQQKVEFLGQASGLLFPIDWPEPFGLVMIEAMACGTPVLAFDRGSVSEIIQNGKTGFVVHSKEEAIERLPRLLALDRDEVRHEFEQRFSVQRMARDHVRLYQKLLMGEQDLSFQASSAPVFVEAGPRLSPPCGPQFSTELASRAVSSTFGGPGNGEQRLNIDVSAAAI